MQLSTLHSKIPRISKVEQVQDIVRLTTFQAVSDTSLAPFPLHNACRLILNCSIDAAQNSCAKSYSGPMSGEFTYKESIPSPVWSPCGSPLMLNINNAVVLRSGGDGDAYFNPKVTVSGLVWRNC